METIHFRKPNMTSMPPEIGRKIIREILNSPKPDRQKKLEECERIELQWLEDEKRGIKVNEKRTPSIEDILY